MYYLSTLSVDGFSLRPVESATPPNDVCLTAGRALNEDGPPRLRPASGACRQEAGRNAGGLSGPGAINCTLENPARRGPASHQIVGKKRKIDGRL